MKGNSQNFIPSFDEIPYISKDYFYSNEMRLIVSKNQISSHRSIDNIGIDRLQHQNQESLVSIQHEHQQEEQQVLKQGPVKTEEFFTTPKKKKKTGCVCKKVGCLKLYCECFKLGVACTDECACNNCKNVKQNAEEIESARSLRKNRCKDQVGKKSCHCKKSQCQKKYCECFNAGVPCSSNCHCSECENGEKQRCDH